MIYFNIKNTLNLLLRIFTITALSFISILSINIIANDDFITSLREDSTIMDDLLSVASNKDDANKALSFFVENLERHITTLGLDKIVKCQTLALGYSNISLKQNVPIAVSAILTAGISSTAFLFFDNQFQKKTRHNVSPDFTQVFVRQADKICTHLCETKTFYSKKPFPPPSPLNSKNIFDSTYKLDDATPSDVTAQRNDDIVKAGELYNLAGCLAYMNLSRAPQVKLTLTEITSIEFYKAISWHSAEQDIEGNSIIRARVNLAKLQKIMTDLALKYQGAEFHELKRQKEQDLKDLGQQLEAQDFFCTYHTQEKEPTLAPGINIFEILDTTKKQKTFISLLNKNSDINYPKDLIEKQMKKHFSMIKTHLNKCKDSHESHITKVNNDTFIINEDRFAAIWHAANTKEELNIQIGLKTCVIIAYAISTTQQVKVDSRDNSDQKMFLKQLIRFNNITTSMTLGVDTSCTKLYTVNPESCTQDAFENRISVCLKNVNPVHLTKPTDEGIRIVELDINHQSSNDENIFDDLFFYAP